MMQQKKLESKTKAFVGVVLSVWSAHASLTSYVIVQESGNEQ